MKTERLMSIDALRGFDMFWIIGADQLVAAIANASHQPIVHKFAIQLEHVEWEGFRFYDLVFPLFLFLVGVVLPFSLDKYLRPATGLADEIRLTPGEPRPYRSDMYRRIIWRTIALIVFGLVYNGILQLDWEQTRLPGVLQRIGICYLITALIVIHAPLVIQWILFAAILAGYWSVLTYIPSPQSFAGDLSPEGNLVGYVDRLIIPGQFCCYKFGDNEGLLSTVPAVATTLLGALCGRWMMSKHEPFLKALGLMAMGGLCLALGLRWGESFPIIKNIWTSSFVLVAGGWSILLLALFYTVIDVWGMRNWTFFFIVIGVNPITIYLLQEVVNFDNIARFFVGGAARRLGETGPVVILMASLGLKWAFLLSLYQRRIFLRV